MVYIILYSVTVFMIKQIDSKPMVIVKNLS